MLGGAAAGRPGQADAGALRCRTERSRKSELGPTGGIGKARGEKIGPNGLDAMEKDSSPKEKEGAQDAGGYLLFLFGGGVFLVLPSCKGAT